MKTKLKFALCALVISLSVVGCCDCKSSKEETATTSKKNADSTKKMISTIPKKYLDAMYEPCFLKGTLTINANTTPQTIHADIYLNSKYDNYTYMESKTLKLLTSKGLAFRYRNTTGDTDDGVDKVAHFTFDFVNDKNWIRGDQVRVMSINENTQSEFNALTSYFYERMAYFKEESVTPFTLGDYNSDWNSRNASGVQVQSYLKFDKKFKPRLAKGDVILGIQ